MSGPEQAVDLAGWRRQVEARARGEQRPVKRGGGRGPRPAAADAWSCEGVWQCDEQIDIWQAADEVELDERRKRGDDSDDEEQD